MNGVLDFGYDFDEPDDVWEIPSSLPNYSCERTIGLDTETYDPGLMDRGPGWAFGNGHLEGVSISVNEVESNYYPLETDRHAGFDPREICAWLTTIYDSDTTLVGHTLLYDYGWLQTIGFKHHGKFFDVQFAESLLDEHKRTYTLDSIAHDYGLEGKVTDALYQWCHNQFGGAVGPKQRANIYRAPLHLVGPYASADAHVPLQIKNIQLPLLEQNDLMSVCDMENALIPMLTAIRKRGVRVDLAARDKLSCRLSSELRSSRKTIVDYAGFDLNVNAPTEIEKVFKKNGWEYGFTEKSGQASFTKGFLSNRDDSFSQAVVLQRSLSKMKTTFVDGYFDKAHNGRLHCLIHPLRTGHNGTVSGRMSTTAPNLGNIPSRDPVYGPLIRNLFLPDEGEEWHCIDFKQAEPRFLAHYARGDGADSLREAYNNDPTMDFHANVQRGTGLDRKSIKILVFSMFYGSGIANTSELLGVDEATAKQFREDFFATNPFIKATFDLCMRVASERGWLKTIMGRRARFPFWEPSDFDLSHELGFYPTRHEAMSAVTEQTGIEFASPRLIKRAKCYKALNSLLQGSVADYLKKSMLDIWNSGVLDVVGAPLLTVYDELDWSVPKTSGGREAVSEIKSFMKNAIKLRVPMDVDDDVGESWGSVE